MKKIMFNDRYGLTDAVLRGTKTMTRRLVSQDILNRVASYQEMYYEGTLSSISTKDALVNMACNERMLGNVYRVGEEVAIARSYEALANSGATQLDKMLETSSTFKKEYCGAGWSNKMFVKAGLMPNRIRITGVKVERLQDISEDDVYREGFTKEAINNGWGNAAWHWEAVLTYIDGLGLYKQIRNTNPQEAFAYLIDKVSGYGTWDSNPFVFAYSFQLIKN